MDAAGLVVRDGDLVSASGRLVREQTADWFEPPSMVAAVGGPRIIRPTRPDAVRVVGADFAELMGRFEAGGAVEGFATLTGIWSAGQLQVLEQKNSLVGNDRVPPRWVRPPCRPPSGGWPVAGHLRFDMGDLRDVEAAVQVTVFRPGPGQEVPVVAATDPAGVETLLRPRVGARLCVVLSRWARGELDAVRSHIHARKRSWNLLRLSQSADDDGQAYIAVELAWVSSETASWATSMPSGILSLDPWLRPTREQSINF
jgi:hypothetical protein